MVKCAKCASEIDGNVCGLACVECSNTFHPACTRTGSAPNLTKNKLKSWKCDSCVGDTASTTSNEDIEDRRSILEALKSMKRDINANTDSKIGAVQESITTLTEEIRSLKEKVGVVEERQTALEQRCSVLEQTNQQLSQELGEMRLRLQDSEQHSRCANIEIQGLPRTTGEDVYEALRHIAAAIGIDYKRADVSVAHRLRLFSKKHSHPPLIVQFVSRSTKEDWISAAKRKKGLSTTHLSPSLQPGPIYINEHLASHNKELLGCARRLLRERKLHYAGYHNGKVLIRRREGEEVVRVTSLRDLEMYDQPSKSS